MVSALDSGVSGLGLSPGWGHCVVFLGKTLLSPTRCINGYQQIAGENLTNCRGVTCDGLASHPGEVEVLLAASFWQLQYGPFGSKASLSLISLFEPLFYSQ